MDGNKKLDFNEFVVFLRLMTQRKEIHSLLHKYSADGQFLTTEELLTFLTGEQKVTIELRNTMDIFHLDFIFDTSS